MCLTVMIVSFIMFKHDKAHADSADAVQSEAEQAQPTNAKAVWMAFITPCAFLLDVVLMLMMNIQGGDATALIGGTAFIILIISDLLGKGAREMLESVSGHLEEGFTFGIKIFAPVIVIGGFFFLGGQGAAQAVFGPKATGLLSDIGSYMAQSVPLSKLPVVLTQAAVAIITGLDGSGFSGLPLIGATAATFSKALPVNKEVLAGMGQILTIWIGGGTLIPWAVIPVAAICDVSPLELVRKNLIPVLCGIAVIVVATLILA